MTRITLINPPLTMEERYGVLAKAGSKLPPLGLCSLASVLRQGGADVSIIDAPALELDVEETTEMAKAYKPDIIGITAVTISINNAAKLAKRLKETGCQCPIILGGPHVTAIPEETLDRFPQFDFAVLGEGEETLLELVSKWNGQINLEEIKGIAFRKNGDIFRTVSRPFIEDLDSLPSPSWDLLPNFPGTYAQSAMRSHRYPSVCLITSRGCYGKCTFCDTACFGRKVRSLSAENLVSQIRDLISRYGVKDISFYDDNFFASRKRTETFCKTLIDEHIDITWSCDSRIDNIRSLEQLKMFQEAGCWQICFGIETGNQSILDEIGKNITLDKIRWAVELTSRAGIHAKGFFMMGLPMETKETLEETVTFAKTLPLTNAHVTFTTPFPGSRLHATAHKYGEFDDDWTRMNMWTPVFIPSGVTERLLQKYRKTFFRTFYLRPRIIYNYLMTIRHPKQLLALMSGFRTLISSLLKPTTNSVRKKAALAMPSATRKAA